MIAPDKTTISLPAGQVLTLACSYDVAGTIVELVGGLPQTPVDVSNAQVYGPYATPKIYRIEISVGTLTVSEAVSTPIDPVAHAALAASYAAFVALFGTLHLYGAGAPVDYTDGTPPATGEGVALKGAIYSDNTNGFVYRNSGTQAQPTWTKLADAA